MLKRFLKIFLILIWFWSISPLLAQSYLNLDIAQNFSTFKFSSNPIESNENPDLIPNYSQISTTAFGIGYRYLHSSGAFIGGGIGFRKAGAALVYKRVNYLWNLQYCDLKAGIGYQYDKWQIKPFVSLLPYYAYLLNAKQSIGLNYYDIKSDKAIKNSDLGIFFNLGANVTLSQYLAIYAEYTYNLGLKNIEPTPEQYLYNRGFGIKLGLSISINTLQGNIVNQPNNNAIENHLDNFTPLQNNLAQNKSAGLNNNKTEINPKGNNVNTSINTTSSSNKSDNAEKEKIISPGTVGWSRNNAKPGKNTINETEDIDESFSEANSTSGTQETSIENETTTSGATSSATAGSVVSNNQTKRNIETDVVKTANTINENPTAGEKQQILAKEELLAENKTIKPKLPVISEKRTLNSDDKIVFKVQLTAVKNSLRSGHPILKNIKGDIKAEKGRDGWVRYYLGTFKTYGEAQKELKKIKGKGIAEGSFIVAFKNGKKITVSEAKELLK